MCGFSGIYNPSGSIPSSTLGIIASEMASTLQHRGPDGEGNWSDEYFAVGHTRLSVQDISEAGAQPMSSKCEKYLIAFNGEIYNHLDIRNNLKEQGKKINWIGHSDTETLIEAISFWGLPITLDKINGMFAFVLWDKEEKTLSLIRDRNGEKPLYWGLVENSLIFGSELKSLRKHPKFNSEISNVALQHYFKLSYIPSPLSIYKDTFKLEPGTYLQIKGSVPSYSPRIAIESNTSYQNITIYKYEKDKQNLSIINELSNLKESELLDILELQLNNSIQKQMLSDVQIGAFLSGGIDSSLLVALMSKQAKNRINTFTIGFEEQKFDEAPLAKEVSLSLDTNHHEFYLSNKDLLSVVPNLSDIYDEPFADSSQIPCNLISKLSSSFITVALAGDGGDELFGGYKRYLNANFQMNILSSIPYKLRKKIGNYILSKGNIKTTKKYLSSGFEYKLNRLIQRIVFVKNIRDLNQEMSSIWHDPSLILKSYEQIESTKKIDLIPTRSYQEQMMFDDLTCYLPDCLLCKMDRASMNYGLEVRMPFLDRQLIQTSLALPLSMKLRGNTTKWALREILSKHVGEKIVKRPKQGFSLPLDLMLRDPLRIWAEDLLSQEMLSKSGLLNTNVIRTHWKQHLDGKANFGNKLWTILMFQSWLSTI